MNVSLEEKKCPTCGGPLKYDQGAKGAVCEYCGCSFKVDDEDEKKKEELYQNCIIRYNCGKSSINFLNIIPYFEELGDYKDSKKYISLCEAAAVRYGNREKILLILKFAIPIALALIIVISVLCYNGARRAKHNINGISVSIVDKRTSIDGYGTYYVYLDYKITNKSGSSINYIYLTTYINKGQKQIGTITTQLGEIYGSGLNLVNGSSVIKETYLQSNNPTKDNLFFELYSNDLSNYNISFKITNVRFGDGETINVS